MVRSLFRRNKERIVIKSTNHPSEKKITKWGKSLQTNLDSLKEILDHPDDLKIRQLSIGDDNTCAFIYIEGMIDPPTFQQSVMGNIEQANNLPEDAKELLDFIYAQMLMIIDVQKGVSIEDVLTPLLSGQTIICFDGVEEALIVDTIGGEQRQIDEPITETLIRGPREGFVENLSTNLGMVRKSLKDPKLRYRSYTIGKRSKSSVVLAYVEDIIHPEVVAEIDRRLRTINIDFVPESGYIEEWIEDSFLSPFPQILNTERPDKVSASLLQGKAVILVDGTPFALVMPIVFANVLQSPEDYYQRWTIGTLLRTLRYAGAFLSIFLPALYVALVSLHPGMIPTHLALSIAGTREGVPFPPVVEAILMITTLEILQEAGARLPKTIGQTIGIVGGLVLGEAAVQAGIISPIMIVVVALTAISTFSIPSYSVAISFRIIRFGFMFAAAVFGLFGIILAYIMINIHFVNLKSFGIPYSAPFAPFFPKDWHDVVLRQPLQTISTRPKNMQVVDEVMADPEGEKK